MTKPNNSLPLVTVYMPTYNRVALLQRAVESVLGQDYRNIELIVVDDNSTDGTHQYLAEMAEKDSRFRYFINEKNSGACVSRNKAIFAANGEYITGLDDDDYFLPNRIQHFITAWYSKQPDCVALYTNSYIKKDNEDYTETKRVSKCGPEHLICHNWIGNQIFTQTEFLQSINGFDEELTAWQDLECWYRLLSTYDSYASLCLPGDSSYVIDISHPHERITTKKLHSISGTFEYFCNKHKLNSNSKNALELQLNAYMNSIPKIKSLLTSISYLPSLKNIDFLVKLYIRSFKKHT